MFVDWGGGGGGGGRERWPEIIKELSLFLTLLCLR